jgi:hypothetical protein
LLRDSRYTGDWLPGEVVPGSHSDAGQAGGPPGRSAGPGLLTVVRPQDHRWRLDGDRSPVLTGIIASTPRLTVARCEVRGTGWSGWLSQAGDTGGYVLSGALLLQLDGRAWHELGPGDGFYLPAGKRYQVRNAAAGITSYLAGSAPTSSQSTTGSRGDLDSGAGTGDPGETRSGSQ